VKCADHGFTRSHQVFLDIEGDEKIDKFTKRLEAANLIVDRGIRLGTNEATRRGMKEREMERVSELIVEVYNGGSLDSVRKRATKLRKSFKSLLYA